MRRKLIISITAVLCIAYITFRTSQALLGNAARSHDRESQPDRTVYVKTIPLSKVTSPVIFQRNGTLRSRRTAELSAQVNEKILRVSKKALNGKIVKEGETLVELDSKPLRIQKEKSLVLIKKYQNEILKLFQKKKNIEREISLHQQVIKLRKNESERVRSLLQKKHASLEKLDGVSVQLLAARGAMIKLKNTLQLIPFTLTDLTESIRAVRVDIDQINLKLENTVIRAPFTGRIIFADVEEGEVARAGKKLFTLYDISSVELPVSISTTEYLKWFAGYEERGDEERPFIKFSLNVSSPAHHPERLVTISGVLSRVEGEISGKTRTAVVVFSLALTEELKRELLPGMFVRADIIVPLKEPHIELERRYIHDNSVYIVKKNSLNIVPVSVLKQPDKRDIILSGLEEGWELVTTPLVYPVEGMKLRVARSE